jgi:hypothetical protein
LSGPDGLRSLQPRTQPAYLEVDPATRLNTTVLVPLRVTIARIEPIKDGLAVELTISHTRIISAARTTAREPLRRCAG